MARERKVVTVLFADLVSFTSRAERLDPEDVEAILAPYHERLRSELERWGGTVEKFIGDAVMALFGAPVTREDDPERAVRAALSIRDWAAEDGELQVRIAVNTGEALVNLDARPEAGEGMAAGDVVNTAARLQTAAPVNGILVGETTYRATERSIEYREAAAVEAKGKEAPIPVWEVVQARARFGVDLAPRTRTPLIGRERELDLLTAALTRSREQRSTELVTLVGVPGIGKSRLVGELFRMIEDGGVLTYWRQGRSLPYGEGVSYWALAEMVKAQAGILETDTEDEVDSKLASALEPLLDEDADWVLAYLRPLVGQADAPGSQEEAFAAWRRFFEALAEARPLVLVFEDVQWADEGLLDFIEHLVDWVRGVPLLLLCTARHELFERRPAWGGGKVNAATIALAPLSSDQTATLLGALSERPLLPAETQKALLERAGGNPLYAEQYVRVLAERGSFDDLPETVQGIIAARLDGLPPEEKRLLQDAAVVGKVFWLGAVGASERELHALERKDFVQRARRSSVEGELEFAFKHVLVRDVAYGQIPRRERAEKHRRVAEWIESLGRPEDHAEMIAHHFSSALELTRASGADDPDLARRTADAFGYAGDRAFSLNALAQAERYYGRALDLTEAADPRHVDLLLKYARVRYVQDDESANELLTEARAQLEAAGKRERAAEAALMLADIAWRGGNSADRTAHLDVARRLIADAPLGRARVLVLGQVARYAMLEQRNEEALAACEEGLARAADLGLDDLRADLLITRATVRVNSGDRRGFDDTAEAIRIASDGNFVQELTRATNNLITFHVIMGDLSRAREAERDALRLGEQYGYRNVLQFAKGTSIAHEFLTGDWTAALDDAERFLAEVAAGARRYQTGAVHLFRGWMRLARGDVAGAVADAEAALGHVQANRDPQALQSTRSIATALFLASGDPGRAGELLDDSIEFVPQVHPLGFVAVELHHLAWTALTLGRESELLAILDAEPFESTWLAAARAIAAGDLPAGADLLEQVGARSYASFYRLWAGTEEQVRRALDFYRSVGATRFVDEGEALLAASA